MHILFLLSCLGIERRAEIWLTNIKFVFVEKGDQRPEWCTNFQQLASVQLQTVLTE